MTNSYIYKSVLGTLRSRFRRNCGRIVPTRDSIYIYIYIYIIFCCWSRERIKIFLNM